MNVDAVRSRFTALQNGFAFFDAPGGTQVPDEVGQAIANALRDASGNLGAPYATGHAVEAILMRAKDDAARFLGATPEEISFGMNMTTLDFALSRTAAREFQAGDEIVTTQLDHDGGVAPWVELAEDKGLVVKVVEATDALTVDYDDLERQLSDRTRVVAFAIASNATGSLADAARICKLARDAGAISWIDAVHYAAHEPIDVARDRLRRAAVLSVQVLRAAPRDRVHAPRARRHVASVQGAAVEAAVRDRHAAVRAARGFQRDDRVPRHDRRDGADPRRTSASSASGSSRAFPRT